MKRSLLSLAALVTMFSVSAQNVNIPDANFKAYLVGNTAINTNSDSEIQLSEAQAFSGMINCSNEQISDLSGIEAFTALTQLNCGENMLTTLDLSNNTALVLIGCHNNQLSSLNVKNGNNSNVTAFKAENNPGLSCIQVDDASYSAANWTSIDATASFNENCATTGIKEALTNRLTAIYPNPTDRTLTIEAKEHTKISILNILGVVVAKQSLRAGKNTIEVSELTRGTYFIQGEQGNTAKFHKE